MASTADDPSTRDWVLISIPLRNLRKRSRSPEQALFDIVQWLRNGDLPYSARELDGEVGSPEFWKARVHAPLRNNWAEQVTRRGRTVIRSPYLSRGGTLASQWENPEHPFAATNPALFSGPTETGPQQPFHPERQVLTRIVVPWERYVELRDKHVPLPVTETPEHKAATLMSAAMSALVKFLPFLTQEKKGEQADRHMMREVKSTIKRLWPPDGNVADEVQTKTVCANINNDKTFQVARKRYVLGEAKWDTVNRALGRDRRYRR